MLVGLSGTAREVVERRAGAMALTARFQLGERRECGQSALRAR